MDVLLGKISTAMPQGTWPKPPGQKILVVS